MPEYICNHAEKCGKHREPCVCGSPHPKHSKGSGHCRPGKCRWTKTVVKCVAIRAKKEKPNG